MTVRVGWLHDDPGFVGGAELTQAEFYSAAPEGVETVICRPGSVAKGLDRYVVHNCQTYSSRDIDAMGDAPRIRYHHDVNRGPHVPSALHIFCSPAQRKRMDMEGRCIPPALDLSGFRQYANSNHRGGAVCIGRMAYGKGLEMLAEYEEPVDVYSSVPVPSEGQVRYRGATDDVAATLARYERFVFLPTAFEPFGRAVVEAWAAGLQIITNRNVGARYWIESEPSKLDTAAEDFWRVVLGWST